MLEAAEAQPESRDDLVEDEHDPVSCGQFPQALEETGCGGDEPHVARGRFDDDAGHVLPMLSHGELHGVEIVEGDRNGKLGEPPGDAGASRDAERGHAGARLDEERVGMPVIAALEFEYFFALRVSPREADGAHGRLRAGADHPDLIHRGKGLDDHPGHLDLGGRRGPVAGSSSGRLSDFPDHGGMRVSEDHGSPRGHVVDVAIAVDVPDLRTGGLCHKKGRRSHGAESPDRAVDTAGNQLLRFFEERERP